VIVKKKLLFIHRYIGFPQKTVYNATGTGPSLSLSLLEKEEE
jgi:hypothetical protein